MTRPSSRATWCEQVGISLHPAGARELTLWDGRAAYGWLWGETPVFRFRWAPAGLATRRQLRAMRMCPGGQEPYAVLVWRNGARWAWLWRLDLARPSRVSSPSQLNALDAAMRVRRTCRACGQVADHCLSVNDRRCAGCTAGRPAGAGEVDPVAAAHWAGRPWDVAA